MKHYKYDIVAEVRKSMEELLEEHRDSAIKAKLRALCASVRNILMENFKKALTEDTEV